MNAWALLAPGPSATREQALQAAERGLRVGVVSNAFELYPEAEFLAASDGHWWRKYEEAQAFEGLKFSAHRVPYAQRLKVDCVERTSNSGVLALEAAVHLGAQSVELYGFDMHGTHFFGPYKNGLTNTSKARREIHMQQYEQWAKAHPDVRVVNCTKGSKLTCFEVAHESR